MDVNIDLISDNFHNNPHWEQQHCPTLCRKTTTYIFLLLIICVCIQSAYARPPWLSPASGVFTESAECHTDDELLDLCQRCAKLTKSRLAYPACCSTDLKARKWCSDYVYFGRGQYDFYTI